MGSFPTKFRSTWTTKTYLNALLADTDSGSHFDSDSPTGFVLLAGLRFGGKPAFLNLEARYIVGTKAKIKDWDTEVDLSGPQVSLLAGFKV